jgi:hypothetical protein
MAGRRPRGATGPVTVPRTMSGRLALTNEIYAAFLFTQAREAWQRPLPPPHLAVPAGPSVPLA